MVLTPFSQRNRESKNCNKTLFTQLLALFKYFLLFALAEDFAAIMAISMSVGEKSI